jgi:predicted PurR-regulated permease PerM
MVIVPPWLGSPAQRYRALLVAALLALGLGLLVAAWTALVPFFLGMFLAYLLLPVVNFLDWRSPRFLRAKRWWRPLAIMIVYVVGVGLIAGVLSYFIPIVTRQAKVFAEIAPRHIARIQQLYTRDIEAFFEQIPEPIRETVDDYLKRAAGNLTDSIQKGLGVTIRTVSQTVSFILGMVIVPFWLFYVLNDEAKVRRSFYGLIPEKAREDVRCIVGIVDDLLSAYLRGQLLLCVVVGIMVTIVLLILRIDLAVLLGTLAGVFELIPILGPYLGAVPAILMALLDRPVLAFWVAVSFAAIQQIENSFLVPRISGSAVRFHPALVMVIVVVGAEVAGLWGLVLAVPVAAVIRDVFQYLYLRTTERGATPQMALECLRARSV